MSAGHAPQRVLVSDLLHTATAGERLLRVVALVSAGVLLTALSARMSIPFWPAPFTMQTLAVLLIAGAYGPRLGTATILAYLGLGALGLPVFAGGGGVAYMLGPTAGYLFGFVPAAAASGALSARGWDRNWRGSAGAMTLGTAVILACGVAWLTRRLGFQAALRGGLVPFLPGALLKIGLGALLLPALWRWKSR